MSPVDKRDVLSRASAALYFTGLLERLPHRRVLIVLTYHRIGDAAACEYDSGVYSASADEFDEHVGYLRKHFHIATADEALAFVEGKAQNHASVFLTFDDGYLDNYETAFPILRSHGVSGAFFLATGFVGSGRVPWWDRIAFLVKKGKRRLIRLTYPEPHEFDLDALGTLEGCRRILRVYRAPNVTDHARFERELAEACDSELPSAEVASPLFMSYAQAREMQSAGMFFGSHTHSHSILTTLAADAQRDEFKMSREILERELGRTIDVLAYPVGSRHAFSDDSINGLKATGYRAAFSHYGGLNKPGEINRFDIRRVPVNRPSYSRLRLQTAVGAITGSRWF